MTTELPDFVALRKRYDTKHSAGARAELRRVAEPDELALTPRSTAFSPASAPTTGICAWLTCRPVQTCDEGQTAWRATG